jgi:cytochrome c oxidase cbb3-type subunit 2
MKHEIIEKNIGLMVILIILVIAVGGLVEIVPLMFQAQTITAAPGVKPYPALQLAGATSSSAKAASVVTRR